jgi:hypothetical protein
MQSNFPINCWDNDEDEINVIKYASYQNSLAAACTARAIHYLKLEAQQSNNVQAKGQRPAKYNKETAMLQYVNSSGETVAVGPTQSSWYLLYVYMPCLSNKFLAKFRRCFRIPYGSFLELAEDARVEGCFPKWMTTSHPGRSKTLECQPTSK